MSVYLTNCTATICSEVADKKFTQADIALSYACAIQSAAAKVDTPNWHTINTAILSRWKMSGLERIKAKAIKLASGGNP